VGWFRQREDRERQLDAALARIYEAQSRQVEALSTFLTQISELSIKRAAITLGTRSAKVRREKRTLLVKERATCPLCINPLRTDVTVEMISAHRTHVPDDSSKANGLDTPSASES
jgi:hypothetical protein